MNKYTCRYNIVKLSFNPDFVVGFENNVSDKIIDDFKAFPVVK